MASQSVTEVSRQVRIVSDFLRRDFGPILDTSDFSNPDPDERRRNFATRALAGLVARDRMACDTARAAAMITDGGQDFGIDAIAIDGGAPNMWLIQTKWNDKGEAKLGEGDVLAMVDGLRKIDHHEFGRFNTKFQAHVEHVKAIWAISHAKITLVLALMRQAPLHDNVLLRLQEVCAEFNKHGSYLDFVVLYLSDIWELVRRSDQAKPVNLSITMDHWFELSTPMRAISGVVQASDVAAWHSAHRDRLFLKNIRESLGVTQVNAEIERSLVDEPFEFWYRNNGVIMLCDRLRLTPRSRSSPHGPATIEVEGASIINGAQTVAAVAAGVRANEGSAGQGLVGLRIIESSDPGTSAQITKATNTQNHIERRDFVALDPTQIAIREEFSLSLDLTYAIRRSEFEPSPESGCTVREAAIALACAHPNPELAVRARRNEALLWEEGPAGAYTRIFGERPNATQIWRSVQLLRSVRDALHKDHAMLEGRAAAIADQAGLVVAHIVFQITGRDGIDDQDFDWSPILKRVPALVSKIVAWLVTEVDQQYGKTSFIASTFGSDDRVRLIAKRVISGVESGVQAPELSRDYRPSVRQRTPRRKNSVPVLVDAACIADGTQLRFRAGTEPERVAMKPWLDEDPRRGVATWVNDRSKPLVWSVDGNRYTPSGLVMRMYALAEWTGAPVAVQGPTRWAVSGEGTLGAMATALQREQDAAVEEEVSEP